MNSSRRSPAVASRCRAKASCSRARSAFGSVAYATSRISRWRNRWAPAPDATFVDHEAAPGQPRQAVPGGRIVDQGRQLAGLEGFADDTGCRNEPLLPGRQRVEAGRDQRLDRFRDADVEAVVACGAPSIVRPDEASLLDQHPDELFAEQRIALGTRDDPGAQLLGHVIDVEQAPDQRPRLVLVEWLQHDHASSSGGRSPTPAPARAVPGARCRRPSAAHRARDRAGLGRSPRRAARPTADRRRPSTTGPVPASASR